jgi:hypothetical protein
MAMSSALDFQRWLDVHGLLRGRWRRTHMAGAGGVTTQSDERLAPPAVARAAPTRGRGRHMLFSRSGTIVLFGFVIQEWQLFSTVWSCWARWPERAWRRALRMNWYQNSFHMVAFITAPPGLYSPSYL